MFITKPATILISLAGSASSFTPTTTHHANVQSKVSSSQLHMADFTLDPTETAFVFIEYQNEFTTEGGKLHDAVKNCMDKTNSK